MGSHVAHRYAAEGARLRLLTRSTSRLDSLSGIDADVVNGDLRQSETLRTALEGCDALVLDVKVGHGAFMKKQVEARRLAQAMVGIGRRLDKKIQALITDMNQPLGYAVGNALEVMEVSQTLQKAGPADLTRLSLELSARMIHVGKITSTLDAKALSRLLRSYGF